MDVWQSARYEIGSAEAQRILCYPREGGCAGRAMILRTIGVFHLLDFGRSSLPGLPLRVLGKGHASVVFAGLLGKTPVAIKSRRLDSKRESLEREGRIMAEASRVGAAPRPLFWSDDIIIMELITGPALREALKLFPERAVIESMRAARALDSIMISHLEINRPWKNVLFTGSHEGSKALIVDYESSGEGCTNVSSLLGGLLPRLDLPLHLLRDPLKRYRRECTSSSYAEIEELVRRLLHKEQEAGVGGR